MTTGVVGGEFGDHQSGGGKRSRISVVTGFSPRAWRAPASSAARRDASPLDGMDRGAPRQRQREGAAPGEEVRDAAGSVRHFLDGRQERRLPMRRRLKERPPAAV